jgi:glutamine synthetase
MNENDGDAKDSAVRMAHEHDVKFIRSKFTDILGLLKSFAITVEKLEDALNDGEVFDGSSIEGFTRNDEHEMLALPDPRTYSDTSLATEGECRRAYVL